MMNQTGFSLWKCKGSVKDFFSVQSNGKVNINSQVVKVVLPRTFEYYFGDNKPYNGGVVFIQEITAELNKLYPAGFQNLTPRTDNGTLWHFNVVMRGYKGIGVAYGVDNCVIKNNGVNLSLNAVNIHAIVPGEHLVINTICHEMGHSVMSWTDYYRTGVSNLGGYCVMASAGTETPMAMNPGLRYRKGWINQVDFFNTTTTRTYSITANNYNQIYKYANPANTKEYLLIAAHIYDNKYYQDGLLPDQGLAIYYVDEEGGLDTWDGYTEPIIHLVEADGKNELQTEGSPGVRGNAGDLFGNTTKTFSAATHPFRWKNGNEIGLTITDISAPAATMLFTVKQLGNSIVVQNQYSNGGTISPRGTIGIVTGETKTFNIIPEHSYVIDDVKLNGVSLGAISSYTFTAGNANYNLSATFKQSATADLVPTPWKELEIGTSRNVGAAGYRNGTFGIESGSYEVWNTNDGLNYIYQDVAGNFEFVAHIASMNKSNEWAKAGLMARETTASGSKYFGFEKTPFNNLVTQIRENTDGYSITNPQEIANPHIYAYHSWFKVTRTGNEFKSYASLDKINWSLMATYTVAMNSSITVGMFAGQGTDFNNTKVVFDNVTLTVSNAPVNLFTKYGIPRSTALPTTVKSYRYIQTIGTGGPNLSNVNNAQFNWDLANNGLWQFSLQTSNGVPAWYTSITNFSSYMFNGPNPNIRIDGSIGFPGIGNKYFVNLLTNGDLVLVAQTGDYALLFTNTAPSTARLSAEVSDENIVAFPNPFTSETSISIPEFYGNASISVTNANGNEVETLVGNGKITLGNSYPNGIYIVKIVSENITETIKLVKQN